MPYWYPHGRLGRVQRAVYRVLEMRNNQPTSTTDILSYSHALRLYGGRLSRYDRRGFTRSVRRACDVLCDRVGRSTSVGYPIMWVLKRRWTPERL